MSIFNRSKVFIIIICMLPFLFVTSCNAKTSEDTQQLLNEKLLDASGEGDISQVKTLIENGADIDATNEFHTVLLIASAKGHTEIVKLLKEAGAN